VCSPQCKTKYMSKPDGTTKHKRGGDGGYILEKASWHPEAKKGFVPQHRLVAERHLGRRLTNNEIIHHINCIPDDNRIENLFLCTSMREHNKAHNSLNKCVSALLDAGVLVFDEDSGEYKPNV
jgi:hypothetical protein